ncbi:Odorant receptor 71a [Drosophila suzukii]|uniref:Odorant receptor n=1 Tax=Drosophila suzukii TaxID=28584 RepID=A0A163LN48_DROSZ|nr:putative odorant receptor 71a [Drosophila suzukii]SAL89171.1 olfactory receptor 71a [Drosophila suzukii]
MDYDRIRPVRHLTGILEWWRLWPKRGSISRPDWTNWRGYLLHIPFTLLFMVLLWVEAMMSRDIEHTADVLLICLTTTALGAKMLNNWKYAHVAQKILSEWSTSDLFELRSKQEVEMWKFEHRRYRRVFIFYGLCSGGVIPLIVIQPLFDIPNRLPFWMWTPFNWHQPNLFWYPFIYEAITIPIVCICNITMDGINWYMMLHLSLCLRMLGQRLSSLRHDDKKLKEKFLELVHVHHRLKLQSLDIENFISKSTFTQILVSSLIICFTIYSMQMRPVTQDLPGFAAMIQYLLAMIMQIMLPSIYGNAVIDSAHMLTDCMYNSDWPDMNPRIRRLILMFMVYLNRPMALKAGGFFHVGLPLFTKTMNQAYSLLALLLNMNQ